MQKQKKAAKGKSADAFKAGRLLPLAEAKKIAERDWKSLVSPVSGYNAARDGFPEEYPGKRAPASYLYLKQRNREPMAHIMAFENANDPYSAHVFIEGTGFVPVRQILHEMKAPAMEDMYLVIGYGSNPCPGQIKAKIEQGRELGVEGINDVMVVFRGHLKGYDPVVAGFFEAGYPSAGLIGDERTENTRCEVWTNLLTAPMLKTINMMEKIVDPYDPSKSDPNAEYALADGYPFQIDGMKSRGKPILVNTVAYTARDRFYRANITLPSGEAYSGPLAFDTLPAENRVFPQNNVQGVLEIVLRDMAKYDGKYEIDRLLHERGIRTVKDVWRLVKDKARIVAIDIERVRPQTKVLALMRWMNMRWREIVNGERPHADIKLTNEVREYMVKKSDSFDMYAKKMEESRVGKCRMLTREEADNPVTVRFGKALPPK